MTTSEVLSFVLLAYTAMVLTVAFGLWVETWLEVRSQRWWKRWEEDQLRKEDEP